MSKYYIIAGEASGDLHGSNLMKGLYAEDPSARIRFWGGALMDAVWKEKDGDRYLGVTALRYQDVKRSYWITPEDGAFHADAWREIDRKLKPAEAIRFDNPLYLINYLGRGDMEAMKAHEKRLLEMENN